MALSGGFNFLPRTSMRLVRVAVALSSVAFLALAVQLLFAFADMRYFFQPVLAALLVLEAIALWQLKLWARTTALWCWGVIITVLIAGCLLNPFFWHDFFTLHHPLGWGFPVILLCITILGFWCWRVLRAHRSAFQVVGRT